MESLAWGGGLLEGPRPDAAGGVFFSEVFGGGVRRWSPEGVSEVIPRRRGIGGVALHAEGGLVVSGRDVSHVREGETRVLLEAPDGVAGFNDLIADRDGGVIVGALRFNALAGESLVPGEFWRIAPDRSAAVLFGPVDWANGVGLAPNGETVYACDYARECVLVWDRSGGAAPRVFATAPEGASCDGLAVDAEGGIWVALAQGGKVGRFDSEGVLVDLLNVPASFVSSVAFGGEELFITTADNTEDPERGATLFRHSAGVAGLAVGAVKA